MVRYKPKKGAKDWKMSISSGFCSFLLIISAIVYLYYVAFIRSMLTESRLESLIRKEAIKGNEVAIQMMSNHFFVKYKDENLIIEALKGNEYALRSLKIKVNSEKSNYENANK